MTPEPTARLTFRSWCDDDLALARGLWGDPRVTKMVSRAPFDDQQVRDRLAYEIANERDHGVQYWPIFRRSNGDHVGCCGLRPRDPAQRILELGFYLHPDHWGQGLVTEAARATMALAFGPLAVSALFAGHHPDNAASRRVLERLGFRPTHAELFPPTGLYHPCYLLRADRDPIP